MKSLKLVLVFAAIGCSATFRLEFSQAADSLLPVVSADNQPEQQHSQNSERSLPVEEKEVKETVVDAESKICAATPTATESGQFRWEADSHRILRYFCSSRDLFNNLGRLRI